MTALPQPDPSYCGIMEPQISMRMTLEQVRDGKLSVEKAFDYFESVRDGAHKDALIAASERIEELYASGRKLEAKG